MVTDLRVSSPPSLKYDTVNANERMELEFLRNEVSKLREQVGVR